MTLIAHYSASTASFGLPTLDALIHLAPELLAQIVSELLEGLSRGNYENGRPPRYCLENLES